MNLHADIVIVGSGVGGGTLASALAGSGAQVLILERGDYLPREPENTSPDAVIRMGRYATREDWRDENGRPYGANAYYHVGGASKMFGASMFRFRERDFETFETADGVLEQILPSLGAPPRLPTIRSATAPSSQRTSWSRWCRRG